MNLKTLVSAFAVSTLALAPAMAADQKTGAQSQDAAQVLAEIHATNNMEISMGKMADSKALSPEVKAYGQQLVSDHTAANQKVQQVARQAGVQLPAAVSETGVREHAADKSHDDMEKLSKLSGAEFDKAFVTAMNKDHAQVIDKLQKAQNDLKGTQVASLIGELLPTLQKHQKTAERLEKASKAG